MGRWVELRCRDCSISFLALSPKILDELCPTCRVRPRVPPTSSRVEIPAEFEKVLAEYGAAASGVYAQILLSER